MHTTWAPKGQTPVIRCSGSWKRLTLAGCIVTDAAGSKPRLFLRSMAGNMDAAGIIRYLKELKRHLGGKKLLLIWDGLPAHRARAVQTYIKSQASWLRVERLPAYAPEVNPIEYLWGAMKKRHLGNLGGNLCALGRALRRCRGKIRDRELLRGFLRASGLY